jgi:hypothetical protein
MVADALLPYLVKVGQGHTGLDVLGNLCQGNSHHMSALSQLLEVGFGFIFDSSEHVFY